MSPRTPLRPHFVVICLVAATATAALAGCATHHHTGTSSSGRPRPRADRVMAYQGPQKSFLIAATTPMVVRQGKVVRDPVNTLQLRDLGNGRLARNLLRSLGSISASPAPDGTVIAVEDFGCRSTVVRIDPATGHLTQVRVLGQSVTHAALSPNGRYLAYLTYPDPQPCTARSQPAHPQPLLMLGHGDLDQLLPNVVAIVNLATGATVRAATSNPGYPPFGLAWNQYSTMIATVDSADNSVALLSAAHPDFATARRLMPPRHCGYLTPAWPAGAVFAVLGCNSQEILLSPGKLVRLSPSGQITRSWALPACINGISAVASPAGGRLLVDEGLGYGSGRPCGVPVPGGYATRISELSGGRLTTVVTWPRGFGQIPMELTGF
jgi:hypothetical protein